MAKSEITIFTPGTFPIPSNVASSVEASIMNMLPHFDGKRTVSVVGRKTDSLETHDSRYVHITAGYRREYIFKALDHLKKHPSPIIQIENRPHFVKAVKKRCPNSKIILVLHSVTYIHPKSISRTHLRKAFSLVDAIVVNSHFLKNEILRDWPNLKEKMYTCHLGVDHQRFAPLLQEEKDSMLNELGLMGKKVILFVGRLRWGKGVHRLITAMQEVKRSCPNALLIVVGGHTYGDNRMTRYVKKLRELAAKVEESVRFISYVPMDEIQRWYGIADVVVTPSIGPEALGLVNLEAMSSGVPVVASRIGGIPEIVCDGETGILVDLDNHVERLSEAIIRVLEDSERAGDLARNARERVENHFTWQHAAERYLEVYKKLDH